MRAPFAKLMLYAISEHGTYPPEETVAQVAERWGCSVEEACNAMDAAKCHRYLIGLDPLPPYAPFDFSLDPSKRSHS